MRSAIYLLNRFIGPFFGGVFMAGVAATDAPMLAATLFVLALVCGWVSLPRTYRQIDRLLNGTA